MTLYMQKETGSVDTYENWIDDKSEGCSREEIDEAIQEGFLIEVELKYQIEGYSKIAKLWSTDYIGDNNYFDLVDEAEEAIKYHRFRI